jgi:hypothetical protein
VNSFKLSAAVGGSSFNGRGRIPVSAGSKDKGLRPLKNPCDGCRKERSCRTLDWEAGQLGGPGQRVKGVECAHLKQLGGWRVRVGWVLVLLLLESKQLTVQQHHCRRGVAGTRA